jgi:hypothetical protein
VFPDQNTKSPRITGKGASTTIAFRAAKAGDFIYFCSVPGHQLAGMQGQFIITTRPEPQTLVEADISREPTDLPPLKLPTAFGPLDWHIHEMICGYVAAAVAGFRLAAIPNWTGRLPVNGYPLAALFALWLLGRIVIAGSAVCAFCSRW